VTERLSNYFIDWKPLVDLCDAAAAQLIHNDDIHILLDLSGYTGHNRLPVFAWKPAPIQVSWLGYWATTGVAEMDVILVDKVGVPEQNHWHFTEKVHYLPDTRLCFTAPPFAILFSKLPVLSKGYITFGCFQNLSKVTDAVLTAWQKILQQLPTARLRFQGKQFRDAMFTEQFIARLERFGITAQRVSTHSISSREDYLRAYHAVDFVLDTFPFTGGTTTCEALWMGVPTLTLAGETLLARQGASLLSAAGLPNWIVASESEYIKQAVVFANNLDYLASLRSRLREQVLASALFDGERFARNFENTLWQLWHDYQSVTLTLGCGKNEIR
jgi:predicted O-linked N-acetylglucosamine transferase (SPINDLY family)